MKKKTIAATVAGVAGASALFGCAPRASSNVPAVEPVIPEVAQTEVAPVVNANERLTVEVAKAVEYKKVANVTGNFTFDQNVLTPSDKVFSLFGTAATALCARPNFAMGQAKQEDYYVTVNGGMDRMYTVSLKEIEEQGKSAVLKCSCSTSGSLVNTEITGMPLADIIKLDELDAEINTITVRGSDGYGQPLPLKLAVQKGAMLVYNVGGEGLTPENGGPVQLWMPGVVASYFTRQVTAIELTTEPEVPDVKTADPDQRAKVSILNAFNDAAFNVGDLLTFEGYADDCGSAVDAVEFSMDGGETWTACATEGATEDKWVYWFFSHVPEQPGTFKLEVRARTADGTVSPLASSVVFTVE